MQLRAGIVAVVIAIAGLSAWAENFKDAFPLGVYWAWERNGTNAEAAGTDVTNYIARMLALCKEKCCDSVWIVNGPGKGSFGFLDLCEKFGIRALISSGLNGYFYHGFGGDMDEIENVAGRMINSVGRKSALLGYILKDEPLLPSVQQTDYFYGLVKRLDPIGRDSTVVAMPQQYQTYVEDTDLPVVSTDIYHFGGNRSTAIPAPQRISKRCYRATCENAVAVASRRAKHVWIMPQAFSEIWGVEYYDERGRHWCQPGSYIHWRMPTPTEIRWQTWEAVRAGAKGVFFFLLNDCWRETLADFSEGGRACKRIDAAKKRLAKCGLDDGKHVEEALTELAPERALTYFGGAPTPQFDALGEAYGRIARAKDLLSKSQRSAVPVFFSDDAECATATFSIFAETNRLGVIVNDELNGSARTVKVAVPSNVECVREIGGGDYELSEPVNGLRTFNLTLEPGDGRCVEAFFAGSHAGLQLLHEDFLRDSCKGNVASFAEIRSSLSFGIGGTRVLCLKRGEPLSKAPAFVISNLTNPRTAVNTAFMNLNLKKRNGNVWMAVRGSEKGVRVEAVLDGNAKVLETDFAHLDGNKAPDAATAESVPTTPLDWSCRLPVQIPVGTTGLRFYLDQPDAQISDLILWYTPDETLRGDRQKR